MVNKMIQRVSVIILLVVIMIGICHITATAEDEDLGRLYWRSVSNGTQKLYVWWNAETKELSFTSDEPDEAAIQNMITAAEIGDETSPEITSSLRNVMKDFATAKEIRFLSAYDLPAGDAAGLFNGRQALTEIEGLSLLGLSDQTSLYNMFNGCSSLTSLNMSGWDTSNVTDIRYLFNDCSNLHNINISGWNLSALTQKTNMFSGCSYIYTVIAQNLVCPKDMNNFFSGLRWCSTVDASGWDLSNTTDTSKLLYGCGDLQTVNASNWKCAVNTTGVFQDCKRIVDLDCSGWDLSNTASIRNLFSGCSALKNLDLSGWDLSNVTNIYSLFYGCYSLKTLDIADWNTSNVSSMGSVFSGCSGLTNLDLSGWDTSNVTSISSMFKDCSSLKELNLSNWTITDKLTYLSYAFNGCNALTSLNLSGWNTSNVTDFSYLFSDCSNLYTLNISGWDLSKLTQKTNIFSGCRYLYTLIAPNLICPQNMNRFFTGLNLTTVDASGWDLSNTTDCTEMFYSCSKLKTLNASNWDLSNVTNIRGLFLGCSSLQDLDLSGWDVSNITSMSSLFSGCSSLKALDIADWNTSNVKGFSTVFEGCSALTSLDLSGWDASNVTSTAAMFSGCSSLAELSLPSFDTGKVSSISSMFSGCSSLTELDLSGLATGKVTTLGDVFNGCSRLHRLNMSNWDISNVPTIQRVGFMRGCTTLQSIDASNLVCPANMSGLFVNLSSLTNLDASGWDMSLVTDTQSTYNSALFSGCTRLKTIDASDWICPGNMFWIFYNCTALEELNCSGWYMTDVEKASNMFSNCAKLKHVDASGWVCPNDMSSIFIGCTSLETVDASGWMMNGVGKMDSLFSGCSSLQTLDLSGWDLSGVTSKTGLFTGCTQLQKIDASDWVCNSDMSGTFADLSKLAELDVTGWETNEVTDLSTMLQNCSSLTELDISGWELGNVANAENMLDGCTGLNKVVVPYYDEEKTIYLPMSMLKQSSRTPSEFFTGAGDTYLRYIEIAFNGNGGTGTMASQYCAWGDSEGDCVVPECSFSLRNKYCVDWNTKPNGRGQAFAIGQSINYEELQSLMAPTDAGIILYAQWDNSLRQYEVRYYKGNISEDNLLGVDTGSANIGEPIPYEDGKYIVSDYEQPGILSGQTIVTVNNDENVLNVVYPAHIHDIVLVATKAPSCLEAGSKEHYECVKCGKKYSDAAGTITISDEDLIISAVGHTPGDPVAENTVAPTCTEDGHHDSVVYCSVCETELSRETIVAPALGHEWGEPEWTWAEDFSTATAVFTCTHDASHTETVEAEVSIDETAETITYTAIVTGPDEKSYSTEKTASKVEPAGSEVIRLAGSRRYDTSICCAKELMERSGAEKFDAVVLTTGVDFPDALAGAYLAAKNGAPVLLINQAFSAQVTEYVNANLSPDGTLYILGGTGVIPDAWVSGIQAGSVKRLAGPNRYMTNIAILKEVGYSGGTIMVCTGNDYADSLSASGVDAPILLVGTALTADQKEYLNGISGAEFVIVGGTGAVSTNVETALAGYGTVMDRLAGANRFETSIKLAEKFCGDPGDAVLAYAMDFPDGLSGGPLAAEIGAPIILTRTATPGPAKNYAEAKDIRSGYVLGGPTLISDDAAKAIFRVEVISLAE